MEFVQWKCAEPVAKEISDEPQSSGYVLLRQGLPRKLVLLRILLSFLMSVNKH